MHNRLGDLKIEMNMQAFIRTIINNTAYMWHENTVLLLIYKLLVHKKLSTNIYITILVNNVLMVNLHE